MILFCEGNVPSSKMDVDGRVDILSRPKRPLNGVRIQNGGG